MPRAAVALNTSNGISNLIFFSHFCWWSYYSSWIVSFVKKKQFTNYNSQKFLMSTSKELEADEHCLMVYRLEPEWCGFNITPAQAGSPSDNFHQPKFHREVNGMSGKVDVVFRYKKNSTETTWIVRRSHFRSRLCNEYIEWKESGIKEFCWNFTKFAKNQWEISWWNSTYGKSAEGAKFLVI